MIILDTNVISEPTNRDADLNVLSWIHRQPVDSLFITSVSLAELLLGIEILPAGKRKRSMTQDMQKLLARLFEDRLLAFDGAAAVAYSLLVSHARRRGYSISFSDGQIAAIAMVHGFAVATRDTAPFLAAGLQVINPWET